MGKFGMMLAIDSRAGAEKSELFADLALIHAITQVIVCFPITHTWNEWLQ